MKINSIRHLGKMGMKKSWVSWSMPMIPVMWKQRQEAFGLRTAWAKM
jgi:hypothetical protein